MSDNEKAPFDPSPYVTKIKGRGQEADYLAVKHRILWLRKENPDAVIVTELERLEHETAVFRAEVKLPTGGAATGWGSETAADFKDYIEKAETKALGRALAALGFGSQFVEDDGVEQTAPARQPRRQQEAPPANGDRIDKWRESVKEAGRLIAGGAAQRPVGMRRLSAMMKAAGPRAEYWEILLDELGGDEGAYHTMVSVLQVDYPTLIEQLKPRLQQPAKVGS